MLRAKLNKQGRLGRKMKSYLSVATQLRLKKYLKNTAALSPYHYHDRLMSFGRVEHVIVDQSFKYNQSA